MSIKEDRIRAITNLYYSNVKVQEAILNFAKDREVVPRYFDGFGRRPDIIQYASDVVGAVRKGATSFHASEELWDDPLHLHSEISFKEMNALRKGWDLLIDVDSPFLDCSKIASKLIIGALEHHGIKNYGLKYSGSKGFHIIISGNAFPKIYNEIECREMFPEWARAISSYLMDYIRKDYNKEVGKILSEREIAKRTKFSEEELRSVHCESCSRVAIKGDVVNLHCPICGLEIQRKNVKLTKRRLKCLNADCAGVLEVGDSKQYYYCDYCKDPENKNLQLSSDKYPDNFEKVEGVNAEKVAALDLVLVAPRHLFRMPYSLHEKTALASIVLNKNEIDSFKPSDADPLRVKIKKFMPDNFESEAAKLLSESLEWKKGREIQEEKFDKKRYKSYKYEEIDMSGVDEKIFPAPIKKLLKGLEDGRKRGLFVLLTFLRSLGYSPEKINEKVREWNEKNSPPLREGYTRSQIEWHLKQKKKILPPNYENDAFYRDLGLLDKKQNVKNPLVDVRRKIFERK